MRPTALTSQPSANVLPTLTGTQVSTAPATLSFTSANWNVPQIVTVTATDDNIVEGTHSSSVSTSVTSSDGNYNNSTVAAISVAITDNDSAMASFAPATVSQSEASSPMAFAVTLSNPVASGVTLSVNSATGTATASNFTPITSGTVTFASNSTIVQTVNVAIRRAGSLGRVVRGRPSTIR